MSGYVARVAEAARQDAEKLCRHFFPDGRREGEWWGNITSPFRNDNRPGSFKINLNDGRGTDFADANHRRFDWLDIAQALDPFITNPTDAAKAIERIIGTIPDELPPASRNGAYKAAYKIITPIPDDAKLPNGFSYKKDGSWVTEKWTKLWTYRDAQGRALHHIARFDKPDGSKDIRPLAWTDEGKYRWKSHPKPRPLYGLDLLVKHPNKPVLVVEGEGCADVANEVQSDYVAVTWSGGTNAVKHSDFSPLAGRKVTIWPDNDDAGKLAARQIAGLLKQGAMSDNVPTAGTPTIEIIEPPKNKPAGWDVADAVKEGSFSSIEKLHKIHYDGLSTTELPKDNVQTQSPSNEKLTSPTRNLSTKIPNPKAVFNKEHLTVAGRPKGTIENLEAMLKWYGIELRYNVLAREVDYTLPSETLYESTKHNDALAVITSVANLNDLKIPEGFIDKLSRTNRYNPAADWILSKPWDGNPRIAMLCDTLVVTDDFNKQLRDALVHRWLLSAVAAAFNEVGNHPRKFWSKGVLVLQGAQDLGKTSWFRRLVNDDISLMDDGLTLNVRDKDSIIEATTKWFVEVGEIESTVRAQDIALLKAFITKRRDVVRKAYARAADSNYRQTVFCGSVNPREYLADKTGNVRFWTIRCESVDYQHDIDMQQLWAEVYEEYKAGMNDAQPPWMLSEKEKELLNESNENHETPDPVFEKIAEYYDWDSDSTLWTAKKTASEVLEAIGYEKPTQIESRSAGSAIRKLSGNQKPRKVGGRRIYLMPHIKTTHSSNTGGWHE